jgi:chromosome segregation ATPase
MGTYIIPCPRCRTLHTWFSNNKDQRCKRCIEDGIENVGNAANTTTQKPLQVGDLMERCTNAEKARDSIVFNNTSLHNKVALLERELVEKQRVVETLRDVSANRYERIADMEEARANERQNAEHLRRTLLDRDAVITDLKSALESEKSAFNVLDKLFTYRSEIVTELSLKVGELTRQLADANKKTWNAGWDAGWKASEELIP